MTDENQINLVRKTALLVEEHPSISLMMREMFRMMGYECIHAASSSSAVEMMNPQTINDYNVMILDHRIPGNYDGVSLARIAIENGYSGRISINSGFHRQSITQRLREEGIEGKVHVCDNKIGSLSQLRECLDLNPMG